MYLPSVLTDGARLKSNAKVPSVATSTRVVMLGAHVSSALVEPSDSSGALFAQPMSAMTAAAKHHPPPRTPKNATTRSLHEKKAARPGDLMFAPPFRVHDDKNSSEGRIARLAIGDKRRAVV